MSEKKIETFEWCGYEWTTCMEEGRLIHPAAPWYYTDSGCARIDGDGALCLTMRHNPTTLDWWNADWTEYTRYNPVISCGLVRSVRPFPIGTRIECEVKAPAGSNLWFSLWLAACDRWPPEIDVFEGYTDATGDYRGRLSLHPQFPFIHRDYRLESCLHYNDSRGRHAHLKARGVRASALDLPLDTRWNRFRLDWRRDAITIDANGNRVRSVTDRKVLSGTRTPGMWVILNIWPGKGFDIGEHGDIDSLRSPFMIRNFKAFKI